MSLSWAVTANDLCIERQLSTLILTSRPNTLETHLHTVSCTAESVLWYKWISTMRAPPPALRHHPLTWIKDKEKKKQMKELLRERQGRDGKGLCVLLASWDFLVPASPPEPKHVCVRALTTLSTPWFFTTGQCSRIPFTALIGCTWGGRLRCNCDKGKMLRLTAFEGPYLTSADWS